MINKKSPRRDLGLVGGPKESLVQVSNQSDAYVWMLTNQMFPK